jgi:DNA-binding MarR family transcriptional regulator
VPRNATSTATDLVRRIQRAYPQIYLACHVRHTTSAAPHGLSQRDSAVLAHLDDLSPVTAGALAKHLGVGPSTVTEAIDHLEHLGLATRTRNPRDKRRVELRITKLGIAKMQESSVLDTRRVADVLARVPARHRPAAIRGMELVTTAARALMKSEKNAQEKRSHA